jgi:hypothetical protein
VPERSFASQPSAARAWVARIVVVTAFVLTVWLCGPRAMEVLAARVDQAAKSSPLVALDRVGFVAQPEWMDRKLLVAVSAALSPWLSDDVPILDDDALGRLRDGLLSVPWVRDVRIERDFPDRLRLGIDLRQPVLGVRAGDGAPLCLVDRDAIVLPWVDTPLPVVFLHREAGGAPTMAVGLGGFAPDPRVRAAAAIAVEWRDELAPLVRGCPRLLEVDTTNLGEKWMVGPHYPEVRVKVARRDGAGVVFAYDRPVDSPLLRVPVKTKAQVLNSVLARHPGLDGLVAGDLRFAVRWADWLQPRGPGIHDPAGNWNELATGESK